MNTTTNSIRNWMTEQIAELVRPATDDAIREWLQGQIQGCLQGNGIAWWIEQPLEDATTDMEELQPLTDSDRETLTAARDAIREADRQLTRGQWEEARLSMLTAHNMLRSAGIAVNRGGGWQRQLEQQLSAVDDALDGATVEPGSLDWIVWQGPEYCELLIQQPWWQDHGLPEVLDTWERGLPIGIVDDSYLTVLPDWIDDDQDQD